MNHESFREYFQAFSQQIAALKEAKGTPPWEEMRAALEDLQLTYEEMQTNLETAEIVEEELLQQNLRLLGDYQHYYKLFHTLPIPYLATDANGIIREANQALAKLLNVPHCYLAGKPFVMYIAQSDRPSFRTKLNQLSQVNDAQIWQMHLCPRESQPLLVELNVALIRNDTGWIEGLRIGIYDISQHHQQIAHPTQQLPQETIQAELKTPVSTLPQSLDGLQVLVVDDEADAREFIAAVLESRGICVTAVATAAAALKTLESFQPDVLVCDIRMPDGDGYSLIRQIRALEANLGRHIPAAALTAYLDESQEKAIKSGFEAHLHKLAQPKELIEMVAQLAGRGKEF